MKLIKKNSPNHFNGREGWKADMICFHQTGGDKLEGALNYYMSRYAECAPNYVIDKNGDIYQLVDPDNGAWANGTATKATDSKFYGFSLSRLVRERATNANYYTYSIEFVHCQWGNINETQITAAVELIKNVIIPHMSRNGVKPVIDRTHVVGHSEITPKTRNPETFNCPGKQFPFDEIIARVNGKAVPAAEVIPASSFAVGDRVTIRESATTYAGVATKIPTVYKGSKMIYTVQKVSGDRVLIKELYSWVWSKDVEKK